MIIDYHPAVLRELESIRDYYDARSIGLGAQFLDEFERQIVQIASSPLRWMVIEDDTRRAMMRRFPYVVYFRLPAPDRVRITVVKHQRRHPDLGRDRQ